jgi:hypothetical protein
MCNRREPDASRRGAALRALALIVLMGALAACENPVWSVIQEDVRPKFPDLVVRNGIQELAPSTGTVDFGEVPLGSQTSIELTIFNQGEAALHLNGEPQLSGDDAFEPTSAPEVVVEPNKQTTLEITFTPSRLGTHMASVIISSDDSETGEWTCVLTGEGTPALAPEITVRDPGNTVLGSGSGTYDYGGFVLGDPDREAQFLIQNTGTAPLNLTGDPFVSISGTNAGEFAVQQPTTPIASGASENFKITLAPSSVGAKSATVTIENNDPDEGTYTFALAATVSAAAAPEIAVKSPTDALLRDGIDIYYFDDTVVNEYTDAVFTIENLGSAELNLTGAPRVSLAGTDAGEFEVTSLPALPASPVTASGSTTFTLRFSPVMSPGERTITVTIPNNDSDENPYTFDVVAQGIAPDIAVTQGATPVADGGSYSFADTPVDDNLDVVFTITNSGDADLELTGTPRVQIGGTHASDYSLHVDPPASVGAAGGSATFTLRFTPSAPGTRNAAISIPNNDPDEAPYSFTISGYGLAPEINVKQGAISYAGGETYDFGSTMMTDPVDVVFTIENLGTDTLELIGGPPIIVIGTDASDFVVWELNTTSIDPGSSAPFTLRFNPTGTGTRNATVTIANNDADEGTYQFNVTGTGEEWHGIQAVEEELSSHLGVGRYGDIAVDGDKIYISYIYEYSLSSRALKLATSANGGATWSLEFLPSYETISDRGQQIAVDGQNIFIPITQYSNDLYMIYSYDGGDTWNTQTIQLSGVTGNVAIALYDNEIYLVYNLGGELRLNVFPYANLSNPADYSIGVDSDHSSVAVDSSNVYVSHSNQFTSTCALSYASQANLNSWTQSTIESGAGYTTGFHNSVAVSGSYLFVSYHTTSGFKIARSSDGGATWSGVYSQPSPYYDSAGEYHSDLVAVGSSVYASYLSSVGSYGRDLSIARSTNNGSTWNTTLVDSTSGAGPFNAIGVDGSSVFISYYQSYSPTYRDLYVAKSIDQGVNW